MKNSYHLPTVIDISSDTPGRMVVEFEVTSTVNT